MGPLPYGPITAHQASSQGPDTNIMKFYITEYSSHHGQDNFTPRLGKHIGTGYKSNFRPGVYYSRKLDELDNPVIGRLVEDNYRSMTKNHFVPSKGSDGRDAFPRGVYMTKGGFVKDVPRTIPTSHQVKGVFPDTKYQGTVYPNKKPLLHLINKAKDPIDRENALHGPKYMSTENHTRFRGDPSHLMDTSVKTVGHKEGSGFTHAYNREPITYRPNETYSGNFPGWYTSRPTGRTLMKTSYRPMANANGTEQFLPLALNAERDTGYTREIKPTAEYTSGPKAFTKLSNVPRAQADRIKKGDPAEYTNMVHPSRFPSMTTTAFQGKQRNDPSLTDQLGNVTIGSKEDTGYTENNCRFIETAETTDTLKRFDTHYKTRFYDKNPTASAILDKNDKRGVMDQLENGFTKSTQVHIQHGVNPTEQLRKLEPYVARSIKSRDPYYDDHIHDDKKKILS